MENKGKFYITTAIAYASRKPHIGNTYEIVLSDAIARYKRSRGYDVFFCTGTDEHGQKIENLANEAGITPQTYVDGISGEIKNIWDMLGCKYDHFIRTTDDYHEEAVKKIFKRLYEQGDIYKSSYEGWYCVPCESFFTDTQAEGGVCPDCGRPLVREHEESYFFKMSKYQDKLMNYIEEHPEFIVPESRRKEMVNNFLKPGLQDLCVSRSSFKWGIPVDFDDKHVVYVWLDALTNYITALGFDGEKGGEKYAKYWPADVHVIGKDIVRFHTIYWPIFLMALGEPLPKQVFGHPWLLFGMDKMSKSKGNVIYADDLIRRFGLDAVRYYLLSEMPYNNDGSITYENVINRYNTDLANTLGNLVSRTVAMTKKYFDGVIPAPSAEEGPDAELKAEAAKAYAGFVANFDEYRAQDALEAVFTLLRRANKYIDETTPWALAKDESKMERLGTVLYNLLETLRISALLLRAIIPESADKILTTIGCYEHEFESASAFGLVKPGVTVGEQSVLFARLDEAKILSEIEAEKEAAKATAEPKEEEKKPELPTREITDHEEEISFDDFCKVELRVAKITNCENIKESKKLLKLTVFDGERERTIMSGIAKWYKPDMLIGKNVGIVMNLAPRAMMGGKYVSEGMIFTADTEDGAASIAFFPDEAVGFRIH